MAASHFQDTETVRGGDNMSRGGEVIKVNEIHVTSKQREGTSKNEGRGIKMYSRKQIRSNYNDVCMTLKMSQ